MLEVLYGARKQIFFTFGPYVLVLFYGANTMTVSLLFAISAACCFIASPIVGKIIDRLGYKVVMVADTLILVIVCFFYNSLGRDPLIGRRCRTQGISPFAYSISDFVCFVRKLPKPHLTILSEERYPITVNLPIPLFPKFLHIPLPDHRSNSIPSLPE